MKLPAKAKSRVEPLPAVEIETKLGETWVALERVRPNTWNPNRMTDAIKESVREGIKEVMEQTGKLAVPIVIRPHPEYPGDYEIIDGEHRFRIFCEESEKGDKRYTRVMANVLQVNTKTAMLLTDSLNRTHGEVDPEAHARYLGRLINEQGYTVEEVAVYLPESSGEIQLILDNYAIPVVEHLDVSNDSAELDAAGKPKGQNEDFLELKFLVSREQAELIMAEHARQASLLKGRNISGRALENMAVLSAQTPLESLQVGTTPAAVEEAYERGAKRRRLKERAA